MITNRRVGAGRKALTEGKSAVPSPLSQNLSRVLVVDDFEPFWHLVSRCLEPHGISVLGAATGEDGLSMARMFRPDVIILDWVLKGMSGLGFVRDLRKDAEICSIPTIMVSAVKEPTDADEARRAGANLFLTKDQMQIALQAYRGPEVEIRQKRARILVVEDDEGTQEFIRYVLAPKGYELEFARNGAGGLQSARISDPSLILLDLGLPGMNGVDVFKLLKDDAATRRIPVLMMTSMADESRVIDSFIQTLHPADYIHKPFGDSELSARVARVIDSAPVPDGDAPILKRLVLVRGRIRMDLTSNKVYVKDRRVRMPLGRFALLRVLLSHDEALSVERLLAEGLPEARDPGTVKKAIQRLRESLRLADAIMTTSHGYRLIG